MAQLKVNKTSDPSRSEITSRGSLDAPSNENDALTASQKRRKQVYQAQKRHRNRQSDYVKKLESEITRLQRLDAKVSSQRAALAHENREMRDLLSRSEALPSDVRTTANGHVHDSDVYSMLGSGTVTIRYDPDIGHERVFVDKMDAAMRDAPPTSPETSGHADPPSPATATTPVEGDSWAALDFILALEHPCRSHVPHVGIAPDAHLPVACQTGLFHGHALTTTSAVLASASPSANPEPTWHLPHSEIDRLVELSAHLDLDDDQITPAQAYAAVRREVPCARDLRPVLEALRRPLALEVRCLGLGSVVPAQRFSEALDEVLRGVCGVTG
ncbi:basic region leucin zipper [Teratosphaeria destructans]|uniref:Basic region leucin zipper n=1 Tax=Teratosphaeria destructans TaxID=418781 RepID=A0A9W7SN95_9PEZI|nr:basic region leucin zipper [Teratosphaeria destructans]